MAIKVKPADVSAAKWEDSASRSADRYATEAESAAEEWAKGASGASDNYQKAVTAAGIQARFKAGVLKAGAAKYARKIRDVAKDRFAPGIHAAKNDYQEEVTPYLQTIAGVNLSARAPRGDPANYRRVEEVGKALNAKRLATLGGGRS